MIPSRLALEEKPVGRKITLPSELARCAATKGAEIVRSLLVLHFGGEAAAVELDVDGVAHGYLRCIAE